MPVPICSRKDSEQGLILWEIKCQTAPSSHVQKINSRDGILIILPSHHWQSEWYIEVIFLRCVCPMRKQKKYFLDVNVPWGNKKSQYEATEASDGKFSADLKTLLQFPVYIIQTEKQSDIVAWSDSKKTVLLIELTVPWEKKTGRKHTSGRKTNTRHCVLTVWKSVGYATWFLLRLVVVVFLDTQSFRFFQKYESLAAVWKLPQIVLRPWHNMHQVGFGRKQEVFCMNEMHTEPPFQCDCVT